MAYKKPCSKQIPNILQSAWSTDVLQESESCTTKVTVTGDTITVGRVIHKRTKDKTKFKMEKERKKRKKTLGKETKNIHASKESTRTKKNYTSNLTSCMISSMISSRVMMPTGLAAPSSGTPRFIDSSVTPGDLLERREAYWRPGGADAERAQIVPTDLSHARCEAPSYPHLTMTHTMSAVNNCTQYITW